MRTRRAAEPRARFQPRSVSTIPAAPSVPDKPEGDFRQTVVIIFFGCSEMEALSIIGLEASTEHSANPKAPLGQGGVMMAIYLLDFSKRYHGNPRSSARLPPGAWAFCATPYATVHGATWAQRIELMPPPQAEQLLRSLARLPGGTRPWVHEEKGLEKFTPLRSPPFLFVGIPKTEGSIRQIESCVKCVCLHC
jgi:hypothetical protein